MSDLLTAADPLSAAYELAKASNLVIVRSSGGPGFKVYRRMGARLCWLGDRDDPAALLALVRRLARATTGD